MQVPVAFFSIHPCERAAERGDEVVAPRLVAVPPAARDALGAGDEIEPLFVYRNGFFQQPCRARPRWREVVRIPVARLHASPGVFRTMIRKRAQAVHGIAPQPRLQALEEPRPVLGLRRAVSEKATAMGAEWREIGRVHADRFDRLRELHAGKLLAQKLAQALGVARRRS